MSRRADFQVPDLPRDRPQVPDVAPLVKALYARNGAGCCWHVVLDDGNWDSVSWCVARIATDGCEAGRDSECHWLAKMLPLMTKTQLRKLCSGRT